MGAARKAEACRMRLMADEGLLEHPVSRATVAVYGTLG